MKTIRPTILRSIFLVSLTIAFVFNAQSNTLNSDNKSNHKISKNASSNLNISTAEKPSSKNQATKYFSNKRMDTLSKSSVTFYDMYGQGNTKTVNDGRKYYKINREEVSRTC